MLSTKPRVAASHHDKSACSSVPSIKPYNLINCWLDKDCLLIFFHPDGAGFKGSLMPGESIITMSFKICFNLGAPCDLYISGKVINVRRYTHDAVGVNPPERRSLIGGFRCVIVGREVVKGCCEE